MMPFFKKHILIIYAILIAFAILFFGFTAKIFIPFEIERRDQIIITIEKGQSLLSISNELRKEGVIDSPIVFRMLITIMGAENSLPAGIYQLADGKTMARISLYEVARRLSTGDSGFKAIKLTIPEGLNIMQIASKVNAEIPAISESEFASSASAYEGYLFPETYFFMPYVTSNEIVEKMRTTFNQKVLKNAVFNEAVASSGRSVSDIVKMASILEGEVRTFEDRKIVSDLLWRRIKIGMPLQVDATFSYINQKTTAELTLNDLKIDSPYNTYKYRGLPPTPISNPGMETLLAAAKPLVIAIGIAVVLIIVALFFTKGIFVVATVNGSPISRLSVIKELEKQGGKQALEAIIDKKLIETELNKKGVIASKEEIDAEIEKIKAQVASQGGTLEAALVQQGLTEEKLREQITIQKKLEKLLADKVTITDAEIDTYIKDSKATPPKDVKMEDFRKQIGDQLKQQKFQQEAQKWVADLTASAKIKYYVNY